jgi:hypothetical protein
MANHRLRARTRSASTIGGTARPIPIIDLKVPRDQVVCFGIYTVHNRVLKLSAQLYPLYPKETREVRLEIEKDGEWTEIAARRSTTSAGPPPSGSPDWDDSKDVKYRLRHGEKASFEGLIRKNPVDKDEIVVAALSCNSNKDRGLRPEYTRNINHQDPDLVFFAGDQSYDHKEHTAAWLKFGLAFRTPSASAPASPSPTTTTSARATSGARAARPPRPKPATTAATSSITNMSKWSSASNAATCPIPTTRRPSSRASACITPASVRRRRFRHPRGPQVQDRPLGRHPMKGPRRTTSSIRNTTPR